MVQRQPEPQVVNRAARLLAALAVILTGCGSDDDRHPSGRQGGGLDASARSTVVRGSAGELAAFVTPLTRKPEAAEWYQQRLASLLDTDGSQTFLGLRLFHLGRLGGPAIGLGDLDLVLDVDGESVRPIELLDSVDPSRFQSSVLAFKALETFRHGEVSPGQSLEAIFVLPGRVGLAQIRGGRLRTAGAEIELQRDTLSRPTFERLLALPSRDEVRLCLADGSDREGGVAGPER